MNEQKLLAVLDMSENEQLKKLAYYIQPKPWIHDSPTAFADIYEQKTHTTCKKCGKEIRISGDKKSLSCTIPEPITESLADLAFRLSGGKIASKKPIEYIIDALIKDLEGKRQ